MGLSQTLSLSDSLSQTLSLSLSLSLFFRSLWLPLCLEGGWLRSTEPGPHARSPVLPGGPSCSLPSPADSGTPSPPPGSASPILATGTLSLVVIILPGEDVTDSPRTNPSPPV